MAIQAILIVYKRRAEETRTIASLLSNYARSPEAFKDFHLLIHDNSPQPHPAPELPFSFSYVYAGGNSGLAGGYNRALERAVGAGYDWLLLLDQDTLLPDTFMEELAVALGSAVKAPEVKAVVPKMFYRGEMFSPSRELFGGTLRPAPEEHSGVCDFDACAVGSGTAVSVPFLQTIGGFNEFFWLDFLDRWLFVSIARAGGRVYVSGSRVEHELSVLNYDEFMTEDRYSNILKYEIVFMRECKPKAELCVYCLRLLKRAVWLFLTAKNKNYAFMTLSHLAKVLFPAPTKAGPNV